MCACNNEKNKDKSENKMIKVEVKYILKPDQRDSFYNSIIEQGIDTAAKNEEGNLKYDFENEVQEGEIICNKAIRDDLLEVFQELYEAKYQLCSVRLVDDFDANDEMSMEANNTSCFNYREIRDTGVLSRHGLGLAIDINPLNNPCVIGDSYEPLTAGEFVDRSKDFDHKIDEDDLAYKLLTEHGFFWGGSWKSVKDYQHFEIPAKK